jgi:hypothetical protein
MPRYYGVLFACRRLGQGDDGNATGEGAHTMLEIISISCPAAEMLRTHHYL